MSPILEVLIGLIFIFSLLSILVTQINAIISQALRLRARYLFDTIKRLLHDKELTARFITHPLIRVVDFTDVKGMERWTVVQDAHNLTEEQAQQILSATLSGVDWINPKTFSNVLLSLVSVKEDRKLFSVLDDIAVQMDDEPQRLDIRRRINAVVDTGQGINELVNMINNLPPSAHKKALVERLRDISKEIGDRGLKTDVNVSLMAGVQFIKDQYLKNAINTILKTSKTLEEVEEKIVKWFDDANYKATELYARDMKVFSYLIGLVIALLINVDTMYIALKLWEDPVLRSAVAQTANTADIERLEATFDEANEAISSDEDVTLDDISDSVAAAGRTLSQIQAARIPIGWNFSDLSDISQDSFEAYKLSDSRYIWNLIPGNNPNFGWMISLKIIGILATMLAVGQGAPFWFNLLRQFR
ncbi:MAG: hypothetical protein ACFE0Q_20540 [Anaerolineae bacterium]